MSTNGINTRAMLVKLNISLWTAGDPEINATAQRMREELTQNSPDLLRKATPIREDVIRSAEDILGRIRGTRRIMAQAA